LQTARKIHAISILTKFRPIQLMNTKQTQICRQWIVREEMFTLSIDVLFIPFHKCYWFSYVTVKYES